MSQNAEHPCPVCGLVQPIENAVCANPDCPWEFLTVLGTHESAQALLEERLAEARAQWQRRVAARQAVLGQARQAAEAICRRLFAHEIGQPGTMTSNELIDRLQAKHSIPPHVLMPLRTLQSHENSAQAAEAEQIGLPGEWGAPALYALAHVTHWYFTNYRGGAMPGGIAQEPRTRTEPAPTLIGGRYRDLGDGTVVDSETGLQWMRCALGQTWGGTTCVGEAFKLSWDAMFQRVRALNAEGGFAGYRDWRVPTIDELKTLVTENMRPAIDQQAFPLDELGESIRFWSSSPAAYSSDDAWFARFDYGYVYGRNKSYRTYVRLVRRGQ